MSKVDEKFQYEHGTNTEHNVPTPPPHFSLQTAPSLSSFMEQFSNFFHILPERNCTGLRSSLLCSLCALFKVGVLKKKTGLSQQSSVARAVCILMCFFYLYPHRLFFFPFSWEPSPQCAVGDTTCHMFKMTCCQFCYQKATACKRTRPEQSSKLVYICLPPASSSSDHCRFPPGEASREITPLLVSVS